MNDKIDAVIEVSRDGKGNVVLNLLDKFGRGYFIFSAQQAKQIAMALLSMAEYAEAEENN